MNRDGSVRDKKYYIMNKEEILKNWQNSGLLEGLLDEEQVCCSQILEESAIHVIKLEKENNKDSEFLRCCTLIFPLIRRIFSDFRKNDIPSEGIKSIIDSSKIFEDLVISYKDQKKSDREYYLEIDLESALIAKFSSNYIKKYNES